MRVTQLYNATYVICRPLKIFLVFHTYPQLHKSFELVPSLSLKRYQNTEKKSKTNVWSMCLISTHVITHITCCGVCCVPSSRHHRHAYIHYPPKSYISFVYTRWWARYSYVKLYNKITFFLHIYVLQKMFRGGSCRFCFVWMMRWRCEDFWW